MIRLRRLVAAAVVGGTVTLASATPAQAHPLGNFTINHYDGLTIRAAALDDLAVLDTAEIPTAQAKPGLDTNHDGMLSDEERAAHAEAGCASLARGLTASADGVTLEFSVTRAGFELRPGAAGLQTSRLECALTAPHRFLRPTTLTFRDSYESDRIGWHEITARAVGTHLDHAPVPSTSVSDALRRYPNDLLASPLDVRAASLRILPGDGLSTLADTIAKVPGAGPIARAVGALDRRLSSLAGSKHLTLGLGLLAVLISVLLGAAHAALPGHGKTVMAAYIAGKRGSVRDAVVVGATVTLTHTAGVLLLGLALTLSASLAGDAVTRDLGAVSGLLIAAIGVGLIRNAIRRGNLEGDHGHSHGPNGHSHNHDEHPHDEHSHDDRAHGHDHDHPHPHRNRRTGRAGLVGMGIAGGLVPSPSALIVLLGAVGLGRTAFGVLMVFAYGVGMAATLTAAGLLLVRFTRSYGKRAGARFGARLAAATPFVTAALVVIVGLGLTARSLAIV